MKYVLLVLLLLGFACSPARAQNTCDTICNDRCAGQHANFASCHSNCKRNCVAQKTNTPAVDKKNYCENKCSGTGATFQTCYNSCLNTYK